jgi:hypothetical protein
VWVSQVVSCVAPCQVGSRVGMGPHARQRALLAMGLVLRLAVALGDTETAVPVEAKGTSMPGAMRIDGSPANGHVALRRQRETSWTSMC